jgi:DNA invertase Pin-like site-specific DNA recombinase
MSYRTLVRSRPVWNTADVRLVGIKYARASQDKKGRSISVSSQIDEGEEFFEEVGIEDAGTFCDNDMSAWLYASEERPEYEKALDMLREGRANLMWTFDSSRAQRDLELYVRVRRVCIETGAFWAYGGRIYDMTNPADRKATARDAVDAEGTSDNISEHSRRGKRKRAKLGLWAGPLPYGYRRQYDPQSGEALDQVVDPEQAAVIRRIVDWVLDGKALMWIARELNGESVPCARDRRWDARLVTKLVDNSTDDDAWKRLLATLDDDARELAGAVVERVRKGEVSKAVAKELNKQGVQYLLPSSWNPSKVRNLALSEAAAGLVVLNKKVIGKGAWEHIISDDERARLVARLCDPNRRWNKDGVRVKHLWSGIALCGECGEPLSRQSETVRSASQYTCRKKGCTSRHKEKLDAYLTEQALRVLERTDAEKLFRIETDTSDAHAAHKEAARLRAELEAWKADAAAGRCSRESFLDIEPGLLDRIKKAEKRAERIKLPPQLRQVIGPNARQAFLSLDIAGQREVLRTIMRPRIYKAQRRGKGVFDTTTIHPGFRYGLSAPTGPTADPAATA